jgi:LAO/AO transport system kinase
MDFSHSELARAKLAKEITLVESTRADHQQEAQKLIAKILPQTGNSIRIGITGVPGVGKSTFIESFGLHLISQGHKVAVLAVDPSSIKTGGSILGDKTRMEKLAQHESAFIRPSPTSGSLGGVARRTREAMLLCEAAGYDVIIVETVGVGQSEIEVSDMVDMFMLLLLPASGDELQGIKKGIVELADLIIVNKTDGDLVSQAKRVHADYSAALRMLHPATNCWTPKVLTCSSINNNGIVEIWQSVKKFEESMREAGEFEKKRSHQAISWMWKEIKEALIYRFINHPTIALQIQSIEESVENGKKSPTQAAMELLAAI